MLVLKTKVEVWNQKKPNAWNCSLYVESTNARPAIGRTVTEEFPNLSQNLWNHHHQHPTMYNVGFLHIFEGCCIWWEGSWGFLPRWDRSNQSCLQLPDREHGGGDGDGGGGDVRDDNDYDDPNNHDCHAYIDDGCCVLCMLCCMTSPWQMLCASVWFSFPAKATAPPHRRQPPKICYRDGGGGDHDQLLLLAVVVNHVYVLIVIIINFTFIKSKLPTIVWSSSLLNLNPASHLLADQSWVVIIMTIIIFTITLLPESCLPPLCWSLAHQEQRQILLWRPARSRHARPG